MVAAPAESVAPAPVGLADAEVAGGSADALAASGTIDDPGVHQGDPPLPGSVDDVYQRCRDLGMRLSRQRRMVLDLLWAERDHLSARDIFEKLNDLGRNIGHTSVYQNLEALQSAGVIECLDRANGRLYGYRADPHSHLTCSETGAIQDLDVVLPEALVRQIEELTGFAIESYTLHLTGRPRR